MALDAARECGAWPEAAGAAWHLLRREKQRDDDADTTGSGEFMSTESGGNRPDDADRSRGQDPRPEPRYGRYAPERSESEGDQQQSPETPPSGSRSSEQAADQSPQNAPWGQPTWGPSGTTGPGSRPAWDQSPYAQEPYGQNPYGENPYGETPYGTNQQQSPYGQNPYGQPSQADQPGYGVPGGYPGGPGAWGGYPGGPGAERPRMPGTVQGARWLMIIAGVLALVWGVLATTQAAPVLEEVLSDEQFQQMMEQDLERQIEQTDDPELRAELENMDPQEMREMMTQASQMVLAIFAVGWGVFLLGVYLLLAFLGTMFNAARVLATIWGALSLTMFVLGFGIGSLYMVISGVVAASIGAVILLWLPASSDYLRQRRAYKEALKRPSPPSYGQPGPTSPYGGPGA